MLPRPWCALPAWLMNRGSKVSRNVSRVREDRSRFSRAPLCTRPDKSLTTVPNFFPLSPSVSYTLCIGVPITAGKLDFSIGIYAAMETSLEFFEAPLFPVTNRIDAHFLPFCPSVGLHRVDPRIANRVDIILRSSTKKKKRKKRERKKTEMLIPQGCTGKKIRCHFSALAVPSSLCVLEFQIILDTRTDQS